MNFFTLGLILVLGAILFIYTQKRRDRRELMSMFQRYNEAKDLQVIVAWIHQRQTPKRLTTVLDFLKDIEEPGLATQVLEHFNLDGLQHRHILIFAAQAYLGARDPKALELASMILEKYPQDDSVLDTYVNIHLTMGSLEEAKRLLVPRLQRKYKGTIFMRHYARILAREGDLKKAVEIMEQVSKRDFVLFQNTFATPQKSQIRQQFEESQALLDALKEQLEGKAADQTS